MPGLKMRCSEKRASCWLSSQKAQRIRLLSSSKSLTRKRRSGQNKRKNKPPPDPTSFFAMNTAFKDPIYRILFRIKNYIWFRWPTKMETPKPGGIRPMSVAMITKIGGT